MAIDDNDGYIPTEQVSSDDPSSKHFLSELADSLVIAENAMPAAKYQEINNASNRLQTNMNEFSGAERVYGPQPETWEGYKPQHQEIKENIKNLAKSYQENKPEEEKNEVLGKTVQSVGDAGAFFKKEYNQLLERDLKMQQEMAAMRQQLAEMQETVNAYSPETMAKCMAISMKFMQEVNTVRQTAQAEKTLGAATLYKNACTAVTEVYHHIKETPDKMKEAIKNKSFETIDKGIRHVTSWFDKGISFMQRKREEFLNLSPLEKEHLTSARAVPDLQPNMKKETVNEPKQQAATISSGQVQQEDSPMDDVIHLSDLMNSDTDKSVQKMIDFMVKAGHNENTIIDAFTTLKCKAINIMHQPQYVNVQDRTETSSMQR